MSTPEFLTIVLFLVLILIVLRYVVPLLRRMDKKKKEELDALVEEFQKMAVKPRKVKTR